MELLLLLTENLLTQRKEDLVNFQMFHRLATKYYRDGQSLYASDPASSVLKVMPYAQYCRLAVNELQALMARSHIVIANFPAEPLTFDEEGLQALKSLDGTIKIRGDVVLAMLVALTDSISDHSASDTKEAHLNATLEQVLESSRNPRGPIISGGPISMPFGEIARSGMSSEIEAWFLTDRSGHVLYPSSSMRWGLCSTAGAHHWIRIESEGLGTFLDVRCGEMLVFIIFNSTRAHFCDVRDFLVNFDTKTAPDKFHVEAVNLTPGTRL